MIPIRRDLDLESNPRICLFFSKNSVTEISCCLVASLCAIAVFFSFGAAVSFGTSSEGIRFPAMGWCFLTVMDGCCGDPVSSREGHGSRIIPRCPSRVSRILTVISTKHQQNPSERAVPDASFHWMYLPRSPVSDPSRVQSSIPWTCWTGVLDDTSKHPNICPYGPF